jgi:uncharacterized membrane protein YjgN (DUF898 family)
MVDSGTAGRIARVEFTGTRSDLFGLLFRGHVLMLPTIGIYRFWMVTWKRRFYWQNTLVDGDALEYTGHATQLLLGFLFAIGFFLPIYIVFFYLSTQSQTIAVIGYGSVAVALWFLTGYAIYRARDFRLSRTLWRGIRFDQKGSAWGYAWRRFGWSILMIWTAGLIYPFMSANLWRYRWRHTWYGDRQFSFAGSWRKLAGPYYLAYFAVLIFTLFLLGYVGSGPEQITLDDGTQIPGAGVWGLTALDLLIAGLGFLFFRARESTRMFSTIGVGEATISVRVRARSLLGQFLLYGLTLLGAAIAFILVILIIVGSMVSAGAGTNGIDPTTLVRMFQSGWVTVVVIILAYLALLSAWSILTETILGYGYWALVARNATITNPDSLRSVRAAGEDTALAGEGLADALNVGAY